MKAFLSYSFENRYEFEKLNQSLKKFLKKQFNIESYAFVYDFKDKTNNKKMMQKALSLIDKSDIIIAELSYKSIGIGIEIGYAKAKNKKIIYIKKINSPLSTTAEGIADYFIKYNQEEDLIKKLRIIFKSIF